MPNQHEFSADDLIRRLDRVESAIETLRTTDDRMNKTLSDLNVTMALMNQTQENIVKREEERRALQAKITMFIVGSFIAAAVTWIVRGGLV